MLSPVKTMCAGSVWIGLIVCGAWCEAASAVESAVSYERDIRPILSDKCYRCHGPDAEARQAELRLDTRVGATEHVVISGKPDDSELITRIFSDDPDVRMPPQESKLALSDDQKQLLRRWIAEGANFAEHWAFQPLPKTVAVPTVKNDGWPRQTLDRFVFARLEDEGLQPTPRADPLRLLRRVTLDLTGRLRFSFPLRKPRLPFLDRLR